MKKILIELIILGVLVAWTINVLLAVFVPRDYFRNYFHVDNSPSLSHKVKSTFGMDLLDLENFLVLTPIVTGEEPFMLTYSMPLKMDAGTMTGYYPDDESAGRRMLVLLDNGRDAHGYEINRQTNGIYLVKWNTTFATNGAHALQIRLYFPAAGAHSVDGPRRIETVTNILQWECGETGFGRRPHFHGFLKVTSADYSIQIYDTNKVLMKKIDGHTDNGVIDEFWDSHPTNKYAWTDKDLKAAIYITPTITDTNGLVKSNAPTIRVPYP